MKRFGPLIKGTLVVVISVIITTLSINATDNIGNLSESLLAAAFKSGGEGCPKGMTLVPLEGGGFCIDLYEASPGKNCPYADPVNVQQTQDNLDRQDCAAASVSGETPWRNIARHQAELACAKAGKRLPTAKEWYHAALGIADSQPPWNSSDCNIGASGASAPEKTGSRQLCASPSGAYDMIGNVWEWVDADIYDGEYAGRTLPDPGFVKGVGGDGVATETNSNVPDPLFNEDYFWSDNAGVRAMIRGGYWGNDSDAGVYATNAEIPPSFSGIGVGFRCAQ